MTEQEIKIPKEMEKEIEKLITERPELGYKSAREFLITACFLQMLRTRGEGGE